MWIDSNTYIGHWPFRQVRNSTCKDLVERMDANGISASVLTNINGIFYKDTQAANRETYDEIKTNRKWADRLIPFAVINPVYSGWKADLKESTSKLGMKGVRIFPKYHRYNLDHPACIELVKMCRDMGIPVGLTLRMVDSRPSSWLDISNEWRLSDIMPIVKAVPDAKFMVLNVAGSTHLEKEDLADAKTREDLQSGNIKRFLGL